MARFYCEANGDRSSASRLARTKAGGSAIAATWRGAIECRVYVDPKTQRYAYEVNRITWPGRSRVETIAAGLFPVDGTTRGDRNG